jgi:hypothetical protein
MVGVSKMWGVVYNGGHGLVVGNKTFYIAREDGCARRSTGRTEQLAAC